MGAEIMAEAVLQADFREQWIAESVRTCEMPNSSFLFI